MYKTLLTLIVLGISTVCYEQKSLIDSLQKVLSISKADTSKVEIVTRLARVYAVGGDMQNSYYYVHWGEKLSDSLKYASGYAKVYNAYGVMYNITGQWDSAIYYQKKLVNYFRKIKNQQKLADALKRISASYANNSDYYNACNTLFEAITQDEAANNIKQLGEDYSNLAAIFADLKLYKLEENYARKSLSLNSTNEILKATDYSNLGNMFTQLKQYDTALFYLKKARLVFEKNEHFYEILSCNINIASAFNQLGKYDSAFKYANYCLHLPVFDLNKFIREDTYGMLGEIYLDKGDLVEAKKYIQEAATFADSTHTLLNQVLNYQNLARLYLKKDNSRKAYKAFDTFMGFNDSLLNNTSITTIALSSFIEEKMDTQKTFLTAQVEESNQGKKWWIVFTICAAVLLIGGILVYRKFEQNKTALHIKNIEQKALRAQLNPHFIFNVMQSIKTEYATSTQKGEELLVSFSLLIREVLDKSFSFEGTLEEEIELLTKYVHLQSQHTSSFLSFNIRVNGEIKTSEIIFPSLALQPVIENAIKYGPADNSIVLDIEKSGKLLIIKVENDLPDNLNIKRSGTGLQLTNERINLFNKKYKAKGNVHFEKNQDKFITIISIAYIVKKQAELT